MGATLSIALAQLASGVHVEENIGNVARIVARATPDCDLIVLPENVLCLGNGASIISAARTQDQWLETLRPLLRQCGAHVVFGGIPIREEDRIMNASVVFAPGGELLCRYDKIHLFQLNPEQPGGTDETRIYSAGTKVVKAEINGWTIGLSICYDLRFPELYRSFTDVDAWICTAAFTQATGEAHWDILLRARATENQCYVLAAGQCGVNADTGVRSYGHSQLIDPWGQILVTSGHDPVLLQTSASKDRIAEVRSTLPALANRRLGLRPGSP